MKKLILYLFTICLGITTMSAQTVTGVVTGADDGQPLPGVNIKVKGTDQGTITDMNGGYTIDVAGESAVLIFSFVGYVTKEQPVGTQTAIDLALEVDSKGLDEVVVVGYGVKKKSLVTGAISSVKAEDLNGSKAFVTNELQGKTAGVTVLPTSGAPGSGIRVRVRGTSSNGNAEPLYIVDGIKVSDIDNIDPSDIESVEILKDGASSAIYGAEGGNGVILLTTKKGKSGATVVNYNFQYGIQSVSELPELLGSADYQTHLNEIGTADKGGVKADTDWLDEIFENAPMQKHYLSIAGGSEKTSIMASISYLNQDGVLGGSKANYERITGRINAEYKAKEWLKMGVNIGYTYSDRKNIGEDSRLDGVLGRALLIDPWTPIVHAANDLDHIQANIDAGEPYRTDESGNYYGVSRYVSGETVNPLLSLDLANGSNKINRVTGSSYLTISPIEGLSFTSRLGFNFSHANNHFYNKLYYYSTERFNRNASVEDQMFTSSKWQWENFINYEKTVGAHRFGITAGVSVEKGYERYLRAVSGPMPSPTDGFNEHDFTSKTTTNVFGNKFDNRVASFFGRVSYDLAGKYLIEASIRRDGAGTSLLPSGSNWGTFPAVSAGWVLSEEDFWSIEAISYAKIRGSWGQNGSLSNLPYFSYSDEMNAQGLVYPAPGGYIPVWEASTLGNKDLTWETSEQLDIGLDLRFLNDKLTFGFDYFNKKTLDLLTLGTPTATAGSDSPYFNAGDVENKGFEFEIGYQNKENDFKYSVNVNLTSLSNEVTRLDDNISIIYGTKIQPAWEGATAFKEGEPIWYFRGYKTEGFDASGNVIISDLSGDGEINNDDKTNIGDPHPDFLYGANINLEYKGFDFTLSLQGSQGNDVLLAWIKTDRANVNIPKFMFDERGQTYAKWTDPQFGQAMESDQLVHDGSYLRVKQIQLGYSLPASITRNIGISKARLFVSLEDYFTFTKYKGMDPEAGSIDANVFTVGDQKGIGQSQGIDRGAYPIPRRVMFGFSLTF